MPKTLFLFQENYMEPKWLELEGDYSHLNQVYINNSPDDVSQVGTLNAYYKKCDELTDLIYHKDSGKHKVTFIDKPTKDWDYFVECGYFSSDVSVIYHTQGWELDLPSALSR